MKHRPFVLILALLLGVAALVSAQEEEPGLVPAGQGLPLLVYPTHEISGVWQPIEITPLEQAPYSVNEVTDEQGADLCVDAQVINLPGGGDTVTNSMTRSDDDPALSCMWGNPSDPGGYRTIWYKVTPEESGFLNVRTNGSTYDTVVAVYASDLENACVNLQQLSCSDDSNFLSSEVTVQVLSGITYYIEVADWQFQAPLKAVASVAASFAPTNNWQVESRLDPARSRHVAVMFGDNAFIIGGQAIDPTGFPVLLNRTEKYNSVTGEWFDLARMCLPGQSCVTGYSNTTGALIDKHIYLPSGYVGNVDLYDGTHWDYSIDSNRWSKANNDIWDTKDPTIYGAAVVEGTGSVGKYYYSGGLRGKMPVDGSVTDDEWSVSADMDIYVPDLDRWFLGSVPPMPSARFGHAAAVQRMKDNNDQEKTYICVMGGLGKSSTGGPILITDGSCYNTASGGWDKNLPELNHPRYFAGSAVDRFGNWTIFGGTDNAGLSVASTEVFDRQNNQWIELDSRFDLGDTSTLPLRPARSWPRGDFRDQTLFSFGGHRNEQKGDIVLGLVESIEMPPLLSSVPQNQSHFPFIINQDRSSNRNSTFASASWIPLNQPISSGFVDADDFVDVYFVQVQSARTIFINLRQIPSGADYDLLVYDDNKGLLGVSSRPGNNDETVNLNVSAGLTYIVVERKLPAPGSTPLPQPFQLLVQG